MTKDTTRRLLEFASRSAGTAAAILAYRYAGSVWVGVGVLACCAIVYGAGVTAQRYQDDAYYEPIINALQYKHEEE